MKKLLLLLFLSLIIQLKGYSQVINNLVVFSNDGEIFTLILNGERQNQMPDSRVKVVGLTLKVYKVTILFENKNLKTHNTTLTFFSTDKECVFTLNKHGKKHTMDYVTDSPINQQNTTTVNTTTVSPNTSYSNTTTTHPTITPTTTYSTTQTTTTNTTTNTSSNNNGNQDLAVKTKLGTFEIDNNGVKINSHNINMGVDEKNKKVNSSVNILGDNISLNKSLKTGCQSPMSGLDFDESKKNVIAQTSDSTRMIAAEKIINVNCMLTDQLKEIMVLFTTDLNKLHFAKKAYSHTSDLSNYGKLEDTFTSDEGKKDLHNFIKNPK